MKKNEKMGRCMKINMFIHFDYLNGCAYRNRFRVANTNYVGCGGDDTIYWIRSNRERNPNEVVYPRIKKERMKKWEENK
jgi:hypothetical protein